MKQETETKIQFMLILLLVTLNLLVIYNGKNLSCDNCKINFNSEYQQEFDVSIKELYLYYQMNKTCIVQTAKGGFILDKNR